MDLGILFGFLGTWVFIIWALMSSKQISMFFDPASMILVVGASFTTLFFAIPVRYLKTMPVVARKAFFHHGRPIEQLIQDMVSYAEVARRDGILSLENTTKNIHDPFIVRGIQMAVDGTDPELIEQILTSELDNLADRHETSKAMFDLLGKYAPAFGMIGTLIGLVIMLKNMNDPAKIGPGMAVAILTTLYGAIIANSICLPLSDRLSRRSAEELLYKTIIIKGVMAIQSGDNPRIVEQKLRTFLPPSVREALDAQKEAA